MTAPTIVTRPVPQGEGETGRVSHIGQRRIDMVLPQCLELVDSVRCMDRLRTRQLLELLDQPAALIVLAAMVPQDLPVTDLLGWVDEPGVTPRTFPTRRLLDGVTDDARRAHSEFNRRKANGQHIDAQLRRGETEYQRLRAVQRRARLKAAQ